ncbi:MAG: nitrilase-related carbon-nitrogen hydrolase, partial [Planctomycetota bacterium]
NGCYVAAVNRIGTEGPAASGIEFWGQSFACDPSGQMLAKAAVSDEQIVTVDLNRDQIEMSRTVWPFFRDRRIDAYDGLTERFLDNS